MRGLSFLFLAWAIVGKAKKVFQAPISSKLIISNGAMPQFPRQSDYQIASNAPLRNALLQVVVSVQCGSNQVFNNVLVDTGSAILWVGGADQPYTPGPNTKAAAVNLTFCEGCKNRSIEGRIFLDTVVIGNATASNQFIGSVNTTTGLNLSPPIDGVLGLGPPYSNFGDIRGLGATPTFVQTLFIDKQITEPMFGIFINPLGTDGTAEGKITFGGIDESKIQGGITWVPNTPNDRQWEFNVSSFSFGSVTLTEPTLSRTDSAAPGISVPFDTFFAMKNVYNGTVESDSNSVLFSFLSFNTSIIPSLPSLDITIGSETFSIPSSRYIVPRELYPMLNVTDVPDLARTWIASAGPGAFNLGQNALQNIYTAYDMGNNNVGFAHISL